MALDQSLWQLTLLAAVYLVDLVVFIGLCREELRDWGRSRGQAKPKATVERNSASAVMAR